MSIIGPLSFIFASFIVYWSGWKTISWLLTSQLVMFVIYLIFAKHVPKNEVSLRQQIKSTCWLVAYYIIMLFISYIGSFGGGKGLIDTPVDLIIIAVVFLGFIIGLNIRAFQKRLLITITILNRKKKHLYNL